MNTVLLSEFPGETQWSASAHYSPNSRTSPCPMTTPSLRPQRSLSPESPLALTRPLRSPLVQGATSHGAFPAFRVWFFCIYFLHISSYKWHHSVIYDLHKSQTPQAGLHSMRAGPDFLLLIHLPRQPARGTRVAGIHSSELTKQWRQPHKHTEHAVNA